MKTKHGIAAAVCGSLLVLAGSPAHANLLINPGGETGDLTGWTVGGTSNPRIDDGSFDRIAPHSGLYDFLGGNGLSGTLTQTVSLAGLTNTQVATVSFWEQALGQGPSSDDAFVSLAFLSAVGSTLGTATTPVVDSYSGAWQNYTGSFAVPLGTTAINYTMNFTLNQGNDLDAFIDDNSLTVSAVPEPDRMLLLCLGMAFIAGAVRRGKAR